MFDKPITLSVLIHVLLFICFFPFSMLFYFPRTSLVIVVGVGIGIVFTLWGIQPIGAIR